MSSFRIQIFSTDFLKNISFGKRSFGEIGRDILGIKIALGLIRPDMSAAEPLPDGTVVPFDDQNWFDCSTGQPTDQLASSTFDKPLESAIMKYQLDNQFLIICYLFKKYGVKNIIGETREVKRKTTSKTIFGIEGDYYRSQSQGEKTYASYDPDSESNAYSSATLRQIKASLVLFDEEFSKLGEATLAVLHGWVPHSIFSNDRYVHPAAISRVVDIVPEAIYQDFRMNKYTQTPADLTSNQTIEHHGLLTGRGEEEWLAAYKASAREDTDWVSDQHTYGYLEYKVVTAGKSVLKAAAEKVLNLPDSSLPPDERVQQLQKIFYPDPFTNPSPFFISTYEIGYFYETDFALEHGALPRSDLETTQQLEEMALLDILKFYNKPDLWWLDKEDEFFSIPYFQGENVPDANHLGKDFPPFEFISIENKLKSVEYALAHSKLESQRGILQTARERLDFSWGGGNSMPDGTAPTVARDEAKNRIKDLEFEIRHLDLSAIKSKNYWVVSTPSTIQTLGEPAPPEAAAAAQTWRELEENSPSPPLIEFSNYITPPLRPGVKYRAFFKINKEKLDLIKDSNGKRLLSEDPAPYKSTSELPAGEGLICTPPDREGSVRTYQEYQAHATKKIGEISRKFKDASYQASLSGSRGRSVDLGLFGNYDVASQGLSTATDLLGLNDLPLWHGQNIAADDIAATNALASPPATDKERGQIKQSAMKITLSYEDLEKRISIAAADLRKAGSILGKEGVKFAPGSNFTASAEASELESLMVKLTEGLKELFAKIPNQARLPQPEDVLLTIEFKRTESEATPRIGPKVGLLAVKAIVTRQDGSALGVLDNTDPPGRPRTEYYLNQIIKMTSATLSGPSIVGARIASYFDTGRKSCADLGASLGFNVEKGTAITYIQSYTSGLKLLPEKNISNWEAFKDWGDERFIDPAHQWAKQSKKNYDESFDAPFDIDTVMKSLGKICTLDELYKEIFDKLDLPSMLCDYLKCIKLPGFELKLPNFHLPPWPKIQVFGFYKHFLEMREKLVKEALVRILCTFVRTIIDKLSIPFCEDQLQEFIAAGSSATPLVNKALASSLTSTGIAAGKENEAKKFFGDSTTMLTGQELCHLFSGRPLDGPTMLVLSRLAAAAGLKIDLDSEEAITNFFSVLGAYLPSEICEELSNYSNPPAAVCSDASDRLRALRALLMADPTGLTREEMQEVLDIATEEINATIAELEVLSGSDIGAGLPDSFSMSGPDAANPANLPDFIIEDLQSATGAIFANAKSSYIAALNRYVSSMNVPIPEVNTPGDPNYNWKDQLELESAATSLEEYTRVMEKINTNEFSDLDESALQVLLIRNQTDIATLQAESDSFVETLAGYRARYDQYLSSDMEQEFRDWGDISNNTSHIRRYINKVNRLTPAEIPAGFSEIEGVENDFQARLMRHELLLAHFNAKTSEIRGEVMDPDDHRFGLARGPYRHLDQRAANTPPPARTVFKQIGTPFGPSPDRGHAFPRWYLDPWAGNNDGDPINEVQIMTTNNAVNAGEKTSEEILEWIGAWNTKIEDLHNLTILFGDWHEFATRVSGYYEVDPTQDQIEAWKVLSPPSWPDTAAQAPRLAEIERLELENQRIEFVQEGVPAITRGALFRLFQLYKIEEYPAGSGHYVHKKFEIGDSGNPVVYGGHPGTLAADMPAGVGVMTETLPAKVIESLLDPQDETTFGLYARPFDHNPDSWSSNRWYWALSDQRLYPFIANQDSGPPCGDSGFRADDAVISNRFTSREDKVRKSEHVELVLGKALHSMGSQSPPARLSAQDIVRTPAGARANNSDVFERSQGFLYALAGQRIQYLSSKIIEILERKKTTFVGQHLPIVKGLLDTARVTDIDTGLGDGDVSFDENENTLSLKLSASPGFAPQISIKEIASRDADKYEVTIGGDYFLRQQPPSTRLWTDDFCDSLPNTHTESFDGPSSHPKRNRFANLYAKRVAAATGFNLLAFRRGKIHEKLYPLTTESMMEKIHSSLTESDMFSGDYAKALDARVGGKAVVTQVCRTNRYSLAASSILSFEKTILQNPVAEVMREYANPDNNPINRDFDDPEPFTIAAQNIGLKGYIRTCLIDLLLKGGIAYAVWDIEPIVGNPIFINYAYTHCFRELEASKLLKDSWGEIITRMTGLDRQDALQGIVRKELLKLPNYSRQIFNPGEEVKDYYNWYFQEKIQNIDVSSERSEPGDSVVDGLWVNSAPLSIAADKPEFLIEHYVKFSGPMNDWALGLDSSNEWSPSIIVGQQEQLFAIPDFNKLLSAAHLQHGEGNDWQQQIENSDIRHGARLVHASGHLGESSSTWLFGDDSNAHQEGLRQGSLLKKSYWTRPHPNDESHGADNAHHWFHFCVPLVEYERPINYDTCPKVFENSIGGARKGIENLRQPGTPLAKYMVEQLLEEDDAKLLFDHIFPVRRFMTISTIFSTSVLAGYNDLPKLMDPVKSMLALSIFTATRKSRPAGLDSQEFQKMLTEKFPGDPSDPTCFDFPGISGEFFEKFWEDLKKLMIMMPSILLRGIANQLDPAYKEMRTHYLNCDIKDLTMSGIRWETVDDSLTNGLYFPNKDPDTCENLDSTTQHGKKLATYAPIIPTMPIDIVASFAGGPWKLPSRLGKTALKTITYAYNGSAPFLDPSFLFKIPCLGIDENFQKGKKYDAGAYGRYGHPLSPFTLMALSTYQLESDIEKQKGNCRVMPEDC